VRDRQTGRERERASLPFQTLKKLHRGKRARMEEVKRREQRIRKLESVGQELTLHRNLMVRGVCVCVCVLCACACVCVCVVGMFPLPPSLSLCVFCVASFRFIYRHF